MGRKLATVCMLQINAAELSDRVLAELLELDSGMVVSLHIQAVDHAEALKMVKRKVTDLDKTKIDEQKKASALRPTTSTSCPAVWKPTVWT